VGEKQEGESRGYIILKARLHLDLTTHFPPSRSFGSCHITKTGFNMLDDMPKFGSFVMCNIGLAPLAQ